MLFKAEHGFCELIENMTTVSFLERVAKCYHYLQEDLPELLTVAEKMQECILGEASFEIGEIQTAQESDRPRQAVVMTLGGSVDKLQDVYTQKGNLTESFMIEALGNELLLCAYGVWNRWIEAETEYHVASYLFPGSSDDYPLQELPKLLADISKTVTCNESFLMIPKKSVAFYTILTKEPGVRCEGVCQGCNRKDCRNRAKEERLLPYGYARILGRDFQ